LNAIDNIHPDITKEAILGVIKVLGVCTLIYFLLLSLDNKSNHTKSITSITPKIEKQEKIKRHEPRHNVLENDARSSEQKWEDITGEKITNN